LSSSWVSGSLSTSLTCHVRQLNLPLGKKLNTIHAMACISLSPITLPINVCNYIIFNQCVCELFQHLYFHMFDY
jgi:hypothetical protein